MILSHSLVAYRLLPKLFFTLFFFITFEMTIVLVIAAQNSLTKYNDYLQYMAAIPIFHGLIERKELT